MDSGNFLSSLSFRTRNNRVNKKFKNFGSHQIGRFGNYLEHSAIEITSLLDANESLLRNPAMEIWSIYNQNQLQFFNPTFPQNLSLPNLKNALYIYGKRFIFISFN